MISCANFSDRLAFEIARKQSILCCGLDPQLKYMPTHVMQDAIAKFGKTWEAVGQCFFAFNRQIIDAVKDHVVCVKPNLAFYECYGPEGIIAYWRTIRYARGAGLLVIGDGKRNDGGDTADAYADGHLGEVAFWGEGTGPEVDLKKEFSPMKVDCLTVTPYIGEDCVGRFIQRVKEHGSAIFVVTKTSFKPNSAVEQLVTASGCEAVGSKGRSVWQDVAMMVQEWGKDTEGKCGLRNVGVVMGATYPDDALIMRTFLPNSWFLVPGYGAQGGGAAAAVVGVREDGLGAIVNNSRNLIYAYKNGKFACLPENFAKAAGKQAEADKHALVSACREAGKWPF